MQGLRYWIGLGALGAAAFAGAAPVFAGANAGGVMMLYVKSDITPSTDPTDYCDDTGLSCPNPFLCDVANPAFDCNAGQKDTVQGGHTTAAAEGETFLFYLMMAFPEERCPRVSGVVFGIEYDEEVLSLLYSGGCGDFELPSGNWPQSFTGTALTWNSPRTSHLEPIYYFVAQWYQNPGGTFTGGTFAIRPHPSQGGPTFASDDVPSVLDPVGTLPGSIPTDFLPELGFGGGTGSNGTWTPTESQSWGHLKHHFSGGPATN